MYLYKQDRFMLRFKLIAGHIIDSVTQEKLSTMEQAADKLNELDILVDFQNDIEQSDGDPDNFFGPE
jgi:hypothetical protein